MSITNREPTASAHQRRSLFIWAMCCIAAALVLLMYIGASVNAGGGTLLMPLDDAYIHFQYAHEIAQGQFYAYNPGLPPTSGATSFLYPYLLAVGDLFGFRGLALGYWAMGIGALALALTLWTTYRIAAQFSDHWAVALYAPGLMAVHGLIQWHFMSGMETGLAMLCTLLVVYYLLVGDVRGTGIAGAVLSLIRPEGALIGLLAAAWMGVHVWRGRRSAIHKNLSSVRQGAWLLLPVIALMVQPIVNMLATGSLIASGNSAKSLFGMVPFDAEVIIGRIFDNFMRMWRDFANPAMIFGDGQTATGFVLLLAMIALVLLLFERGKRGFAALFLLWALGFAAAVSTLDTAFWHFRRYQMPLVAVLFALAGIGFGLLWRKIGVLLLASLLIAVAIVPTVPYFLFAYALNVGYVHDQPFQMANWLRDNAPANAVIAVHDVGMMRYMGGHTTLDIVGLTTLGAADYWRNGPGSVGEFLMRSRPDLIASYGEGHGFGLGYLQHTGLYGTTLASYTVSLDGTRNVALAAATQGIYQPDYTPADRQSSLSVLPQIYPTAWDQTRLLDSVNVADIESERAHSYRWTASGALGGFPTEFYQFNTISCTASDCAIMDGGRRINGEERFALHAESGHDAVLITRIHPENAGTFDVYADDQFVETRVIPALPGSWIEVPTLIPGAMITSVSVNIRIVPHVPGGDYMPYYHWLYPANPLPVDEPSTLTSFQDGAIQVLGSSRFSVSGGTLSGEIDWFTAGGAQGDDAYFVHVYAADNLDTVLAQIDSRPGRGMLPPGNWLPGMIRETMNLNLADLPTGRYRVAFGLYDPVTFARLTPTGGDAQNRFWWGSFENP